MNEIQLFSNPEFGNVRVIDINGEPWFVAADVANALGYSNTSDAVSRHVPDKYKKDGIGIRDTIGREQFPTLINEAGMYELVLRSKLPNAEKFSDWACEEVLPAIRKHGAYMTPDTIERILSDPDTIIQLATQLKAERERNAVLKTQVAELQPKASYYDRVLQCPEVVSTSAIAKDYGKSGRTFNQILHSLGVEFKQGDIWLLYQKYARLGWTQTKSHVYIDKSGKEHCRVHTYWTQKGRLGLYELLKRNGYLPLIEQ